MTDRKKIALHIAGGTALFVWAGGLLITEYPIDFTWNFSGFIAGVGLLVIGIHDLVVFLKNRRKRR